MTWRLYSADPDARKRPSPVKLIPLSTAWSDDGQGYVPERGLVDAVNVALALSQPLLVTGEPGTGKTQLAFSIATQLGLAEPLVFHTKTTSAARDLFYSYDALRHFRDSHLRGGSDGRLPDGDSGNVARSVDAYITYEALGLAILISMDRNGVADVLPPTYYEREEQRSVVLIDEIDKAPRDVPNDVLYEIEEFGFTVRETGRSFRAPAENRPIVILTSNSERVLPDAFLRRCVFYHLSFPDDEQLRRIIESRLGSELARRSWIERAIALFLRARDLSLDKKPATAEFLSWLRFLAAIEQETGKDPVADGMPEEGDPLLVKTDDSRRILSANRPR